MYQIHEPNYLITRQTFKKVQEEINKSSKPLGDLNRMIWGRDIYSINKDKLVELKRFSSAVLYELLYKDYRLFFIKEKSGHYYKDNVFWVNILNKDTLYEMHKDESIITFKFTNDDEIKTVRNLDGNLTAVHIGNVYVRYCSIKGLNISEINSKNAFWTDVVNSMNGKNNNIEFNTSQFGSYIIVHSIKGN